MFKKVLILCILSMVGCASNVPKSISTKPLKSINVAQAISDPATHRTQDVRWGGSIASVKNLAKRTRFEIVSRELYKSGRPLESDHSDGRFFAYVDGFVDPDVYPKGRDITVHGTLGEPEPGKIGEYNYQYPVVQVDTLHLWDEVREDPYPWGFYDPWFHPWYYHPAYGYRGHNYFFGHYYPYGYPY